MTIEIPEPVVYMVAGAIVDRVVKNIFGSGLKDIFVNALDYFNEKQRLKEIEARRVVDVMGDTVGYINDSGNITKVI
jgi:hypothetical protein